MDINEAYVKYKELFDFAEINVKLEDIVDVEELMKTGKYNCTNKIEFDFENYL